VFSNLEEELDQSMTQPISGVLSSKSDAEGKTGYAILTGKVYEVMRKASAAMVSRTGGEDTTA
jgi:hypothetical protein